MKSKPYWMLFVLFAIQIAAFGFMGLVHAGVVPLQAYVKRWPNATFVIAMLWILAPPPLAIATALRARMKRVAKSIIVAAESIFLLLLLAGLFANALR